MHSYGSGNLTPEPAQIPVIVQSNEIWRFSKRHTWANACCWSLWSASTSRIGKISVSGAGRDNIQDDIRELNAIDDIKTMIHEIYKIFERILLQLSISDMLCKWYRTLCQNIKGYWN
jgi:hypothetical protein